MKLEDTRGTMDFTATVGEAQPRPRKVHERCYKSPTTSGRRVKGTHGYSFDYVSVGSVAGPDIPLDAELQPIEARQQQLKGAV
jgi:hypothetical protein